MYYVTVTGGPIGAERRYLGKRRLYSTTLRHAKPYDTFKQADSDAAALRNLLRPRGYVVGTMQRSKGAR